MQSNNLDHHFLDDFKGARNFTCTRELALLSGGEPKTRCNILNCPLISPVQDDPNTGIDLVATIEKAALFTGGSTETRATYFGLRRRFHPWFWRRCSCSHQKSRGAGEDADKPHADIRNKVADKSKRIEILWATCGEKPFVFVTRRP